jgi:hypothetical protein
MILIPADTNFQYNAVDTSSDIFKAIAIYNSINFYETDLNGVVSNEIPNQYFFIDRIDLASPRINTNEIRYDGLLFIGKPSEHGTDVNNSTFDIGQYESIVKNLLTKSFIKTLELYVKCSFEIVINNVRPLYNSVKFTKSTNTTGVEISYSIWI